MFEGVTMQIAGGEFSARDFMRAAIARDPSLGLPLAQLLLLSRP